MWFLKKQKKQKKIKLSSASSMNNGIVFYSKRHKWYRCVATVDEKGNVTAKWLSMKEYWRSKSVKELFQIVLEFLIYLLPLIPLLIVSYIVLDWTYMYRPYLMPRIVFLLYLFTVVAALFSRTFKYWIKEKNNQQNMLRFHSAEHMSINAYEKLNRPPTIDEVKSFSRYSKDCGTNVATYCLLFFLGCFLCTFIPYTHWKLIIVILIILSISLFVLIELNLLNFMQAFTTASPTDCELEVAVVGIQVWYENEIKHKKIEIEHATSMDNGIIFYSACHKHCYCETTIDENGKITSKWVNNQDKEKKSLKKILLKIWNYLLLILKVLPFATILAFILFWLIEYSYMLYLRVVFLAYSLMNVIPFFIRVSRERKKVKNYFKYHSAEHMGIRAFEKNNRPPTLEEIRDSSRYSNDCGCTQIAFFSLHFLLLFFMTFITSIRIFIILSIVEITLLVFLRKTGRLNFLQKFNTETPTDQELEVAAIGIRTWYENEIKDDI